MVWTAPASREFYRKFIWQNQQHFSEDTVEEVERAMRFRQSRLDDFAASV